MRRFVGALCVLACVALVGCVPSGREWFDPPEGKTSFEKRQTISEFMEHTEPVSWSLSPMLCGAIVAMNCITSGTRGSCSVRTALGLV